MHWKGIFRSQLVVKQQVQNQRILFSKNGNGLPDCTPTTSYQVDPRELAVSDIVVS
jgi:hypothetical protein